MKTACGDENLLRFLQFLEVQGKRSVLRHQSENSVKGDTVVVESRQSFAGCGAENLAQNRSGGRKVEKKRKCGLLKLFAIDDGAQDSPHHDPQGDGVVKKIDDQKNEPGDGREFDSHGLVHG